MFGPVRTAVARRLEEGAYGGPLARATSRRLAPILSWSLARPLVLPPGIAVVTVGGATLGGSGKTRVALACTRELARLGVRAALVGHAYGAHPGAARFVAPDDPVAEVGDEAIACASALASTASVVVGPSRADAVALAASRADVLVIDGALQLSPTRAALALLAVDADAPWGAGDIPPSGDLRAPREALLAHADLVVPVDAAPERTVVDALRGVRFGLFTALARPGRLVSALARQGLRPEAHIAAADHGPGAACLREVQWLDARVDLWLATAKCAVHLRALAPGRPLRILSPAMTLPASALAALATLARGAAI